MERILHIPGCEAMNRTNGINSFLMNVYRNIDRNRFQFDFVVYGNEPGEYDNEIIKLGGRIYHVSSPGKNLLKNGIQTYTIIKNNKYNIIHRHTTVSMCWMDFFVARLAGVEVRICHSHGNSCKDIIKHKICYPLFIHNITDFLACGYDAGRWLYGNNRPFKVIKNGIDVEKYKFNILNRDKLRNKYSISKSTIWVGSIGRISEQKNPLYLIDIIYELIKLNDNVKGVFVGDGELMCEAVNKVKDLNIQDKVIFTGVSNVVQDWLSSIDVMVCPSLYEGFPVAILEGEANGLPIVISDKVPKEVDITGLIKIVPIASSPKEWAIHILRHFQGYNIDNRIKYAHKVIEAGYDIKSTIKDLEEYYDKTLKTTKK